MIDFNKSGEIEIFEAEIIVLSLNSQLIRSYGKAEIKSFLSPVSGGSSKIGRCA